MDLTNAHSRKAALLLAAVFAVSLPAAADAEPCGLKMVVSYPMQNNPLGVTVVPVPVEHVTKQMIVDTGAFTGMLSVDTVRSLGLSEHDLAGTVYSQFGRMRHYTQADIEIGVLHADALRFLVAGPFADPKKESFDGSIGLDVLSTFDLDLDYGAGKVNLMMPDHCPGQVVYWTKDYAVIPFESDGNNIKVPATLDGKAFTAIIDTGTSDSVLDAFVARDDFGVQAEAANTDADGSFRTTLHTLTIGGITVQNPSFFVVPDRIERDLRQDTTSMNLPSKGMPDIIIGNSILRRLHLYFAFSEKKLYVTAADAH